MRKLSVSVLRVMRDGDGQPMEMADGHPRQAMEHFTIGVMRSQIKALCKALGLEKDLGILETNVTGETRTVEIPRRALTGLAIHLQHQTIYGIGVSAAVLDDTLENLQAARLAMTDTNARCFLTGEF